MRRKITETEQPEDDLPDLTEQQRNFVEGILSGKTASDAYRAAYNCESMADRTIWAEASRLRAHHNVSAWLARARKAGLGHARVTLEGHISELERLREIALDTGNVGAAVQAEQLRGKASGHYVEQYRDLTADPLDLLREIAKESPAEAQRLAREAGIQWQIADTQH